jgi:hypothetical protein
MNAVPAGQIWINDVRAWPEMQFWFDEHHPSTRFAVIWIMKTTESARNSSGGFCMSRRRSRRQGQCAVEDLRNDVARGLAIRLQNCWFDAGECGIDDVRASTHAASVPVNRSSCNLKVQTDNLAKMAQADASVASKTLLSTL